MISILPSDQVRGNKSGAEITLVEYGDFQCDRCAQAHQKLINLRRDLGPRLRFVFRHFPVMQKHEKALLGALSAEAASLQGRFWEMHDALLENQDEFLLWGASPLARAINLNLADFQWSLQENSLMPKIRADFMSAIRNGVEKTPTFFLNGRFYDGPLEAPYFWEFIAAA